MENGVIDSYDEYLTLVRISVVQSRWTKQDQMQSCRPIKASIIATVLTCESTRDSGRFERGIHTGYACCDLLAIHTDSDRV